MWGTKLLPLVPQHKRNVRWPSQLEIVTRRFQQLQRSSAQSCDNSPGQKQTEKGCSWVWTIPSFQIFGSFQIPRDFSSARIRSLFDMYKHFILVWFPLLFCVDISPSLITYTWVVLPKMTYLPSQKKRSLTMTIFLWFGVCLVSSLSKHLPSTIVFNTIHCPSYCDNCLYSGLQEAVEAQHFWNDIPRRRQRRWQYFFSKQTFLVLAVQARHPRGGTFLPEPNCNGLQSSIVDGSVTV